jgi:hypothetical protein
MDAMARALSGKTTTAEAWSTIFMKPSSKQWNAVKVAIKVNCINIRIMPKIPIVGKVCKELINQGVLESNITIYDGDSNASGNSKYTPFIGKGIPTGVVVYPSDNIGPNVPVGTGTLQCIALLAQQNGSTITYPIDILVNCAVNKGHGSSYGGFTMCMKNHTGTLKFSCPSTEELITENQCEAIIGGTNGAPYRQQLCIIDSLWSAIDGPSKDPTHLPCNIAMGTVAPAVDYQVSQFIRKTIMKVSPNQTVIDNWLTRFNLNKANLEWIEVPSAAIVGVNHTADNRHRSGNCVRVSLNNGSFKPAVVSFNLSAADNKSGRVSISDMGGRVMRRLNLSGRQDISRDGMDDSGRPVSMGRYIVELRAGGKAQSAGITVSR